MEQPDVALHMATAKRGTWQKISDAAKTLAHLAYNAYTCTFAARTDGAYFLIAEGLDRTFELILVAPDDSIDFAALGSTDVVSALTMVRNYVGPTPIPGWAEFVTWFGRKMVNYGGYVGSATVCGLSAEMPLPTFPANATQYDTFEWLRQVADGAGCDSVPLNDYRVGSYDKFAIPVSVTAAGLTVRMEIQIAI